MSQSTPTTTPSRRRPPLDTPGSTRSNTSTTDRTTLLDRVESLDLEVHDLRRQISAERSRVRRRSTTSSSGSSLSLSYFDPTGRDVQGVKRVLLDKLREMDDDALTTLLTASRGQLWKFVGGEMAGLMPGKSVGIEVGGSASEVDRRILFLTERGEEEDRRGREVQAWLKDRQGRLTSLLSHLAQFSLFDINTLTQNSTAGRRRVRMAGSVARLFLIDISFDVIEDNPSTSTAASPQIQSLQLTLPSWLTPVLNQHNLYNRLLRRNDLPALLLMLRTMIPLLSLRRNLFTSLMETYTDLARDHVRRWESEHGVDFTPYHPSSSGSKKKGVDESLGKSLIDPAAASSFTLSNKRGASLTIHFNITWNRFGHAHPNISATPNIPASLSTRATSAFLTGFEAELAHLLRVAIDQTGIVGLADQDDEEELGEGTGRWGVGAALNAVVRAFFRLDGDAGVEGESESGNE